MSLTHSLLSFLFFEISFCVAIKGLVLNQSAFLIKLGCNFSFFCSVLLLLLYSQWLLITRDNHVCVCVWNNKGFIHAWKSVVLTQGNSFAFLTKSTMHFSTIAQVLSGCYSLDNSTKKGNTNEQQNCKNPSFIWYAMREIIIVVYSLSPEIMIPKG